MSVEFDHHLKNLIAQYEEPFDAHAWEQMELGLNAQRDKKKRAGWLIFVLCFITLSSAFYGFYQWNMQLDQSIVQSSKPESKTKIESEYNKTNVSKEDLPTQILAIEQNTNIENDLLQTIGETKLDKDLKENIKGNNYSPKNSLVKNKSKENFQSNSNNQKRKQSKKQSHNKENNIAVYAASKYELKKHPIEKSINKEQIKTDNDNEIWASQHSKPEKLEIIGMENQSAQFISIEQQKDSLVNAEEKIFSINPTDSKTENRKKRNGKTLHWVATIQAGGGIGTADSSIHSPMQYQVQGMGGIAIHTKKNQPLIELTAGLGFQQNHYAVYLSEKIDDTSTLIKFENTYSNLTIPIQLKYYFLRGERLKLYVGLTMINNIVINRNFTNTIDVIQLIFPNNAPPGKNVPSNIQNQYEKDQFPYPESAESIEKIQSDMYNKQSYYISGMASLGMTYPIKKDKIFWMMEGYYFVEPKIVQLGYKHNFGLNIGLRFGF